MKKVFLTLGLIVLVGAAAAWYFVSFRMDGVIETRIERVATQVLGSRVEVGGVETDLRDGALRIRELTVANPSGFENPHAFRFTGIEAALDYASRDIKRILIEQPEFVIEERDGTTNYARLLEAIEAHLPPADESAAPEPEITIRHFRINAARAALESASLDRVTDVGIDAIELHDLRGTPSELAQRIGKAVIGELSAAAGTALLKAEAGKRLGEAKEQAGGKLRGLLGGDEDAAQEN